MLKELERMSQINVEIISHRFSAGLACVGCHELWGSAALQAPEPGPRWEEEAATRQRGERRQRGKQQRQWGGQRRPQSHALTGPEEGQRGESPPSASVKASGSVRLKTLPCFLTFDRTSQRLYCSTQSLLFRDSSAPFPCPEEITCKTHSGERNN